MFFCPECRFPAVNIADGYDPFDQGEKLVRLTELAVEMRCANRHRWIESQSYDKKGQPEGERKKDIV